MMLPKTAPAATPYLPVRLCARVRVHVLDAYVLVCTRTHACVLARMCVHACASIRTIVQRLGEFVKKVEGLRLAGGGVWVVEQPECMRCGAGQSGAVAHTGQGLGCMPAGSARAGVRFAAGCGAAARAPTWRPLCRHTLGRARGPGGRTQRGATAGSAGAPGGGGGHASAPASGVWRPHLRGTAPRSSSASPTAAGTRCSRPAGSAGWAGPRPALPPPPLPPRPAAAARLAAPLPCPAVAAVPRPSRVLCSERSLTRHLPGPKPFAADTNWAKICCSWVVIMDLRRDVSDSGAHFRNGERRRRGRGHGADATEAGGRAGVDAEANRDATYTGAALDVHGA